MLRLSARVARSLGRIRAFHVAALVAVRHFNRGSFRRLGRDPAVAAVYVRGSFVRGPFYPLSSDVDLTLVLRAAQAADAASLTRFLAVLGRERRRNPSLRDWWQHLILDRELPIVHRYWELFASDEWRDERGAAPFLEAPAADRPRLLRAHWVQQCAWSASAVQAFVRPGVPGHDFRAGHRKCAFLASRLCAIAASGGSLQGPTDLFALRRQHALAFAAAYRPPAADDAGRIAALASMLRELTASASAVRATLPPAAVPGAPVAASDAHPSMAAWPAALAALRDLSGCDAVVLGERALYVAVGGDIDGGRLAAILAVLRRDGAADRPLTYLVPTATLDLWPLPCDTVPPELLACEKSRGALFVAASGDVERLRELMLFDALFLPSAARLALAFPDRDERLLRLASNLARGVLLYADGRVCASFAEVVAVSRESGGSLADLAPELVAVRGATKAADQNAAARRYALCAELAARLYAALATLASPPCPPSAVDVGAASHSGA